MRWLANLTWRLRAIFRRAEMNRELDEEMAFHLEMEAGKNRARGLESKEARRRAHVRFGGKDSQRELAREAWGVGLIDATVCDLRQSVRQLRRHPAFTTLATLTLALGIGGTVALFSVVNGVLLRPLPFDAEERLLTFWSAQSWRGAEFDYLEERVSVFESLAAYGQDGNTLRGRDGSTQVTLVAATATLFDVLGAPAQLGRTFATGDDQPGAEPVAVLSHGLWSLEHGADPEIVGKRIDLGGTPTTVVGVMPASFYFPSPEFRLWVPLVRDPDDQNYQGNGWLELIGRVRPDVAASQLDAELLSIAAALGERFTYPDAWDKTKGAYFRPLREHLLGDVRPAVLLLMGSVALVLLMACANVTALTLTRTSDRSGELAVRTALGAGRFRLARQILTESMTLGVLAGAVGMALAVGLFDLLVASLPLQGGFQDTLALDWTTFVVAMVLSLAVGAAVCAIPIRGLLAGRLDGALGGARGQGGAATPNGRMQGALVVAEVLLAVMLVTGATLLVRSVSHLQSLDSGIDPQGVLVLDVLAEETMDDASQRAFQEQVVEQAAALPGVQAAGLINRLPIRDGGWQGTVDIEDRPDLRDGRRPNSMWRTVSPGYFAAMGIEITRGRAFDGADGADAIPVVIVSHSFAETMWPGQDPIGKRVGDRISGAGWTTVVGVAEEVRMFGLVGPNSMAMYRPKAQLPFLASGNVLVLRTRLEPTALAAPARALIRQLSSAVAIDRVTPMQAVVADAMVEPLRIRFLLSLFALLGLILGTVGVYGVVSYSVTRRKVEYGIRMALGAHPGTLLKEVVGAGILPVVGGIVGGIVASLVFAGALASFLFGVESTDPTSFALAGLALLGAGAMAAAIPGYRASRTNPVEALRGE